MCTWRSTTARAWATRRCSPRPARSRGEVERPPCQIVDVGMTERFLLREMDKHERLKRTIPRLPLEVGCKLWGVC